MTEEGTITPEIQINQLEDALATETDRLKKLFAAYEAQEKELVDARAEIEVLEKEIIDKEIEREAQESLIAEKDFRIRELEMKATKAEKRVEHLQPALQTMEEKYSREKDRLGKVFGIAEDFAKTIFLTRVFFFHCLESWLEMFNTLVCLSGLHFEFTDSEILLCDK